MATEVSVLFCFLMYVKEGLCGDGSVCFILLLDVCQGRLVWRRKCLFLIVCYWLQCRHVSELSDKKVEFGPTFVQVYVQPC